MQSPLLLSALQSVPVAPLLLFAEMPWGSHRYGYWQDRYAYDRYDAYDDRVSRAFNQPLSLSQCRYFPQEKKWTFKVSSSSGDSYYDLVVTPKKGTCSCPDFERRAKPCKHLLCVLLRVLRLKTEFKNVTEIGRNYDQITTTLLNLFSKNTAKPVTENDTKKSEDQHVSPGDEEEMCLICLLEFSPTQDNITKCSADCGRYLGHKDCLNTWFSRNNTCPLCKGMQRTCRPAMQADGAAELTEGVFFEIVGDIPPIHDTLVDTDCPVQTPPTLEIASSPLPAASSQGRKRRSNDVNIVVSATPKPRKSRKKAST